MFGDGIVIAESPSDFKDKVDYYLQNAEERLSIAAKGYQYVKNNHTSVHRVCEILQYFGLDDFAEQLMTSYRESLDG